MIDPPLSFAARSVRCMDLTAGGFTRNSVATANGIMCKTDRQIPTCQVEALGPMCCCPNASAHPRYQRPSPACTRPAMYSRLRLPSCRPGTNMAVVNGWRRGRRADTCLLSFPSYWGPRKWHV